MANDYYRILQVSRNASGDELKKAAEAKLKQISKAYDVLSDPRKRAAYDQHGEEGLRADSPRSSSQNGRTAEEVFPEYFGSRAGGPRVRVSQGPGVFTEFFGSPSSQPGFTVSRNSEDVFSTGWSRSPENRNVFGEDIFESFRNVTMDSGNASRKASPIETILPCTLEELYQGATKKMKISRNVIGASGRKTTVEEILTVEIKPGWKKGTKITFPEKGNDEQKGVIPADVIFVVDEKPHSLYERDGNDLIVSRNISLADALTGHTARLKALDGRNLTVFVDSVFTLNHQEVVRGEGMPISKELPKRGNLIVKFTINFPTLTSEQKTGIKQLLTLHNGW